MKVSKQVQKSEKKLNVLWGGYMNRQKNLLSRINQLHRDMDMSRINYLCFSKLAAHEQKSIYLMLVIWFCSVSVPYERSKRKIEDRERKTFYSSKEIQIPCKSVKWIKLDCLLIHGSFILFSFCYFLFIFIYFRDVFW